MAAGSLTLGGNMSIALGPLGRNGEALGSLNTKGKMAAMYVPVLYRLAIFTASPYLALPFLRRPLPFCRSPSPMPIHFSHTYSHAPPGTPTPKPAASSAASPSRAPSSSTAKMRTTRPTAPPSPPSSSSPARSSPPRGRGRSSRRSRRARGSPVIDSGCTTAASATSAPGQATRSAGSAAGGIRRARPRI